MSLYPNIAAGQRVTAALLRSMLPEVIVKPSTTDRTATITLTNDPDLALTLAANAAFQVQFVLLFGAIAVADVKTEWIVPPGASGFKSVLSPSSTAAEASADNITVRAGIHLHGTDIIYNGVRNDSALAFRCQEDGILTTTAAGTLALAWSQGTSNPTPTRLFSGSWMQVRRIG